MLLRMISSDEPCSINISVVLEVPPFAPNVTSLFLWADCYCWIADDSMWSLDWFRWWQLKRIWAISLADLSYFFYPERARAAAALFIPELRNIGVSGRFLTFSISSSDTISSVSLLSLAVVGCKLFWFCCCCNAAFEWFAASTVNDPMAAGAVVSELCSGVSLDCFDSLPLFYSEDLGRRLSLPPMDWPSELTSW